MLCSFVKKMSWDLRVKIEREEPGLRYFSTEPTPHNKADEGSFVISTALQFHIRDRRMQERHG